MGESQREERAGVKRQMRSGNPKLVGVARVGAQPCRESQTLWLER